MKPYNRFVIFVLVLTILVPVIALACTTFCFQHNGDWVFGRNYDWMTEHCLIIVNKRGVDKTALIRDTPAQWVSKYGSVTFNQYGREFPLGGMNEKGLVIENMWLEQTEYPQPDARAAMQELQWIQYQLDNHATVAEVLASDTNVRIAVGFAVPLHFLVCDRQGNAAAIEFLGGKMIVHTKETLPISALTNSIYDDCMNLYNDFKDDETTEAFDAADYSVKRFVWAGQKVSAWDPKTCGDAVDYAFMTLDKVAVDMTQIRIVYDAQANRVYYHTKSNPNTRFLDFSAFDLSCNTPVKILDISAGEGNVTAAFTDYTFEANYELIKTNFAATDFLKDISEEAIQNRARYPETLPSVK